MTKQRHSPEAAAALVTIAVECARSTGAEGGGDGTTTALDDAPQPTARRSNPSGRHTRNTIARL
jgi:hypothetical protein